MCVQKDDPTDVIPTEVLGDLIARRPQLRRHQPTLLLPEATPVRAIPVLEEIAARRAELEPRRGELIQIVREAILDPDDSGRDDLLTIAAGLVFAIERIDQAADALAADARPCDTEPPSAGGPGEAA